MTTIHLRIRGGGVVAAGLLGVDGAAYPIPTPNPDRLNVSHLWRDLAPGPWAVYVEWTDGTMTTREQDTSIVGPDWSVEVDAPWRAGPTDQQWSSKTNKTPLPKGAGGNVIRPDYSPPAGWTPPKGYRPPSEDDRWGGEVEPGDPIGVDDDEPGNGLLLLLLLAAAAVAAS